MPPKPSYEALEQRVRELESREDNQKELINRLRTYQAELEIQNEELRTAQIQLETSRDRFSALFNLAPAGYVILDRSGIIVEANSTFCRMLDKGYTDILKTAFADFIVGDDRPVFHSRYRSFFKSPEGKSIHVRLARPGDETIHTRLEAQFSEIYGGGLLMIVQDITERKKTRAALIEREQQLSQEKDRFFNLLNSLPAFVYLQRADHTMAYANDRFKSLFGSDLNLLCHKAIQGQDTPCDPCPTFEVFRTRKSQEWEWDRGDGTVYQIYDYPFYDGDGELMVLEMGIDITDRITAEKTVKESEVKYRQLVEAYPGILYSFSTEKGGFYVSARVKEILGYTADYLMENAFVWYNSIHPEDRHAADRAISGARQGKAFDIEYRIRDRQGRWHWFRDRSIDIRKGHDDAAIDGVAMDITERKRTEQKIRESESKFRKLFDVAAIPLCYVDDQGVILDFNPKFTQVFGYTKSDIPTLEEWWVLAYPDPAYREWVVDTWDTAVENSRRDNTDIRSVEYRVTCKNGDVKNVIIGGTTFESYFLATFIDLTDLKQAEKELQETLTDLERSNEELQQFAYVASHDLQEPLRAVVGFLQLLESRYRSQLDEKGLHYIERSVKAGQRMQTLISDLLVLSRVTTRGADFVETDLTGLVNEVLDHIQHKIDEKGAEVTVGPLPRAAVDPNQIYRLFQNLVLNALVYNESDVPVIDISSREEADCHRFRIRDNGIGIPAQFHTKIFQIFQRLHHRRDYPGTGLGLALCKKIVERHGGTLGLESAEGEGATFLFTLPK